MTRRRAGLVALTLGVIACDQGGDAPVTATVTATATATATATGAATEAATEAASKAGTVTASATGTGGECATAERCHADAVQEERQHHSVRAVALYTRACDLGSARSCHRAGELLRDDHSLEAGDLDARQLFERGCQQGSTAACDALGH